ncbi:MAG TPA: hypothetical protein VNC84_07770 [Gammaproteobacteria bacterium]|jgi:hypothetical protein|nr:hypothetical protein [Gammaproteobacteria bacterium]
MSLTREQVTGKSMTTLTDHKVVRKETCLLLCSIKGAIDDGREIVSRMKGLAHEHGCMLGLMKLEGISDQLNILITDYPELRKIGIVFDGLNPEGIRNLEGWESTALTGREEIFATKQFNTMMGDREIVLRFYGGTLFGMLEEELLRIDLKDGERSDVAVAADRMLESVSEDSGAEEAAPASLPEQPKKKRKKKKKGKKPKAEENLQIDMFCDPKKLNIPLLENKVISTGSDRGSGFVTMIDDRYSSTLSKNKHVKKFADDLSRKTGMKICDIFQRKMSPLHFQRMLLSGNTPEDQQAIILEMYNMLFVNRFGRETNRNASRIDVIMKTIQQLADQSFKIKPKWFASLTADTIESLYQAKAKSAPLHFSEGSVATEMAALSMQKYFTMHPDLKTVYLLIYNEELLKYLHISELISHPYSAGSYTHSCGKITLEGGRELTVHVYTTSASSELAEILTPLCMQYAVDRTGLSQDALPSTSVPSGALQARPALFSLSSLSLEDAVLRVQSKEGYGKK